ncbi:hypothetical protein CKAN_02144000 [Cinnamomum micranthum f. kanehirae]|uniref:GRF-type domain-containing protein n=1 Tax=Cinnamomum micranthum f. kanehirae TaxID=337451 RepID=A0A443PN79_9MAGN|nr:hypothetical protein CKAN_02144000 [Cinnamomum micranthum f. kanehirae]
MSSASSSVRNLEWVPKCLCGYRYMILKTSRTAQNPGRRFWKCPDLHGERGCGLFIWMDEVANEYSPVRSMGRVQIESREDEMRTLLEEMKQEIKHEIKFLREKFKFTIWTLRSPNLKKKNPSGGGSTGDLNRGTQIGFDRFDRLGWKSARMEQEANENVFRRKIVEFKVHGMDSEFPKFQKKIHREVGLPVT